MPELDLGGAALLGTHREGVELSGRAPTLGVL